MNQTLDPTTIILAALAIFIVWKLRSVLGARTGTERPPFNPFARRDRSDAATTGPTETGRVIPLPGAAPAKPEPAPADPARWRSVLVEENEAATAGLNAIVAADPSFTPQSFLGGARAAYEMIVAAFAKGDRAALKNLLSSDVFEGFSSAIAARDARGETVQHTFVALSKALIEDASLRGGTAQITVLFESQQINAVHGRDGSATDAGTEGVGNVVDHWTFARDTGSRDPNWRLVATQAE